MRKPTLNEFFAGEAIVWLLAIFSIAYFNDWQGAMGLAFFFLKFSALNIGISIFNIIGACVGATTGFFPWSREP